MKDQEKKPGEATQPETSYPRGDLLKAAVDLVEDHSQAKLAVLHDPFTAMPVPFVISRDAEGGQIVAVIPNEEFDSYRGHPVRRRGTANFTSVDSLIAHVKRFSDNDSIVFACNDRDRPSLTAVLDYYPAGGRDKLVPAAWCEHRSFFAFPLSDEWRAWKARNGAKMSVPEFAAFIEDRIVDVIAPGEVELAEWQRKFVDRLGGEERIATPTDLFTLSKGLRVNESSEFSNVTNLATGEGEVVARVEHTDKNGVTLRLPNVFLIAVPVFRNGAPYALLARLRYRANSGAMSFWYELWGQDRVFDHAFTEAADKVSKETGLPVLLGSPEEQEKF